MLSRARKPFSENDYTCNGKAFQYLQRDLAAHANCAGVHYFPVLRPEDYDIDVAVYASEQDYKAGKDPIAFIELEVKESRFRKWLKGQFPFPDIHFLYRKTGEIQQTALPFWICYNEDGTDCAIAEMESFMSFPIARNTSPAKDFVYTLPKELFVFGPENIVSMMDQFVRDQMGYTKKDMKQHWLAAYALANRSFRLRHRYDQTRETHSSMRLRQQRNDCPIGVNQYL